MADTSVTELDARTHGAECMRVRPSGAISSRSDGLGPSCSREEVSSNHGKDGERR
jgi:hypothetical protein